MKLILYVRGNRYLRREGPVHRSEGPVHNRATRGPLAPTTATAAADETEGHCSQLRDARRETGGMYERREEVSNSV